MDGDHRDEASFRRAIAPFAYELPDELIAVRPPSERDGGRLLDLRGEGLSHKRVRDLPNLLRAGDLLVTNDTRVMRARLFGHRATGGRVEFLFLDALADQDGLIRAMVRPARRLKSGERVDVGEAGHVEMGAPNPDGTWSLRCHPGPGELMAAAGQLPLPPYLGRTEELADRERYQTVFAREAGAVAAPTAGLHLTTALLAGLDAAGVVHTSVTLHVGPGTFRPLRPADLLAGKLHAEAYEVSEDAVAAVAACRSRGGRVVAVGTTATRTLESAFAGGELCVGRGRTELFIRPGYRFQAVDLLLTNFHLPGTSLLMLVAALGGTERVMGAVRTAVSERYRFYSYGDAMLVEPPPD